jgi:hypothetical protein
MAGDGTERQWLAPGTAVNCYFDAGHPPLT